MFAFYQKVVIIILGHFPIAGPKIIQYTIFTFAGGINNGKKNENHGW